jgi:hypothetical protein
MCIATSIMLIKEKYRQKCEHNIVYGFITNDIIRYRNKRQQAEILKSIIACGM